MLERSLRSVSVVRTLCELPTNTTGAIECLDQVNSIKQEITEKCLEMLDMFQEVYQMIKMSIQTFLLYGRLQAAGYYSVGNTKGNLESLVVCGESQLDTSNLTDVNVVK